MFYRGIEALLNVLYARIGGGGLYPGISPLAYKPLGLYMDSFGVFENLNFGLFRV